MRAVEPRSKGCHQFRLAVAIGIAQAQDGPAPRQRQEDIAIGRHGQPARIAESPGELIDGKSGREAKRGRILPGRDLRGVVGAVGGVGLGEMRGVDLKALARRLVEELGRGGPCRRQERERCEDDDKGRFGRHGNKT